MTMLFHCDVCRSHLDRREVFEVELAVGSLLLGDNMESRFVPSRQPDEYLLCAPCAGYFERAVATLQRGGGTSRREGQEAPHREAPDQQAPDREAVAS